jgi:hypothetical protein
MMAQAAADGVVIQGGAEAMAAAIREAIAEVTASATDR